MRYIVRSNGLRPVAEASRRKPLLRRRTGPRRGARIASRRQTLSLWAGILALALGISTSGTAKASEFAYLAYANSFESLAVGNEDGKNPRILLSESSTFYWGGGSAIALSPDGRYVAFCANETDKVTGYHLYMYLREINTNTPKWKILVSGSCESFDFSPDGHHLLYSGGEADIDIRELTLDGNYQPISNRAVVSWGGDQINARYAPDGKHIVFSSNANSEGQLFGEEWPYEFHLFKTDLEGNEPSNLTQEFGAFYSMSPDIHFANQAIVFSCGFRDPEKGWITWNICRTTMTGSEATDLGVKGWDPQWTADGSAIVYNVENGAAYDIWEMNPNGEDQHVLPLDKLPGPIGYSVNSVAARQTSTGDDALARIFSPTMRFDEGERWKPLELDKMFEEIPPRVCIKKKCSQVFDPGELASKSGSNPASAVLDIPPVEGEWDTKPHVSDADNYGALDCTSLEGQGTDCEDPEHSAIYYDTSHISPGGYQYLEYWFFYRFNDSPVDTGPGGEALDHEADWENVSVGIPYGIPVTTFDFVTFAQHGSSYAYLRENLTCEEGDECGIASKHVDAYIAGGTHASYGESCSGIVECRQSGGLIPETDHGGEVNWLNNGDAAALRRLPETYAGPWLEGPHGFTDWPGTWGYDGGLDPAIDGPAVRDNLDQFDTPWLAECFSGLIGGGECDKEEEQGLSSSNETSEASAVARSIEVPNACRRWFGSGVSAVLCSQPRLEDSISEAAIGRREGSADLVHVRRGNEVAAATTGGLAQMSGPPLRPGDELAISGDIGRDAILLIRAEADETLTEAAFSLPERSAGTNARIARNIADGDVSAVPLVLLGDGEKLEPVSVRTVKGR